MGRTESWEQRKSWETPFVVVYGEGTEERDGHTYRRALECGKSDESRTMGVKDLQTDCQSENEGRRRTGGIQEKNFERNESYMAAGESTDNGRE